MILLSLFILSMILAGNRLNRSIDYQLFGEIIPRINTTQKVIALTLDDGPSEKTATVLSILQRHNIKATFFPIGNIMQSQLNIVQQIVQDGHELGNHSFTHQKMILKTYGTIRAEIKPTDALIRQAGYQGDIHFRPPFGAKLLMLPLYLKQQNRKTITWNICPEGDPAINEDPEKLAQFIIDHATNGSIILLHPTNEGREASLQALEPIIIGLKAKGFAFKTVSELLLMEGS